MCCEADWKREIVPDHKFDFINVREFHRNDFMTRLKYIWKYVLILKSLAVYGLDIFTAITMISSDHWTNAIQTRCGNDCAVEVQFSIAKWIFVGCIIFSFLLLAYETYKAKRVIDSRDISYAFTNLIANDYYSLRSYDNFCLFCHIDNSTKRADDFAFFIYFTFKDWKRLLLADGPRQSINALILFSFAAANHWNFTDLPSWWNDSLLTAMLLFSMIATVLIFAGSLILLVAAAVLYVPLLCYIQGNLKEYMCYKVDKRISELIKRKQRDRIRKNAALEKKLAQSGGTVKNSKGEVVLPSMPQPTLPNISLDDDDYSIKRKGGSSSRGRGGRCGTKSPNEDYDYALGLGYPPGVEYQAPYGNRGIGYTEDYGSSTRLTSAAAPLGISHPPTASQQSLPAYSQSYTTLVPPSRSNSSLNYPQPNYQSGYRQPSPGYGQRPGRGVRQGSGLSYDEDDAVLAYDRPYSGGR